MEQPATRRSALRGPPSFAGRTRTAVRLEFSGEIWYWRGPAPFYFVTVPDRQSRVIREIAAEVTYGWGMIGVHATIGETTWYTAMFAKDERYLLPVKAAIRRAEDVDDGDVVSVTAEVLQAAEPRDW